MYFLKQEWKVLSDFLAVAYHVKLVPLVRWCGMINDDESPIGENKATLIDGDSNNENRATLVDDGNNNDLSRGDMMNWM